MGLARLAQTIRTARHLRWSQLVTRARKTVRARLPSLGNGRRTYADVPEPVLADREGFPHVPASYHTGLTGRALVESLERGEFHHLNQTVRVGRESPDWRLGTVRQERLWTVTLHYHQWLYELARIVAQGDSNPGGENLVDRADVLLSDYLGDWLDQCDSNVPGSEHLAWNPYAIATRTGWWVRSVQLLHKGFARRHLELMSRWLESMWRQARYLHANLEWDLRANHLLRDAVGLAWVGRFFRDAESDCWLRTASKLAVSQAHEQVLADGGHFERSPMYHLEVMDDWLALALLLEDPDAQAAMRDVWRRTAEYIVWLRHPNGQIPQLNDAALRCPDEHLALGEQLRTPLDLRRRVGGRYFDASGVVVWHGDPWTVFFDVGEIGPDYQPGHAHADTLTIECSFEGSRLFIDPGCLCYDNDQRRHYDRSTAAHNTVCIDETDSSEVWHVFRVGRRARPCAAEVETRAAGFRATSAHDGYDHLPGKPRHQREVSATNGGPLQVTDRIDGRGPHAVEGGLLLDSSWTATACKDGWLLSEDGSPPLRVRVACDEPLHLTMESRPVCPEYGLEVESMRLTWRWQGVLPVKTHLLVEPA